MIGTQRFRLFANLVRKQYPNATKILDVAGGNGQVAVELSKFADVQMIEPVSWPNIVKVKAKGIVVHDDYFHKEYKLRNGFKPDVIVGLHPHEATSEIVLWANRNNIPYCICPCCKVGRLSEYCPNFNSWLDMLKTISNDNVKQCLIPGRSSRRQALLTN